jgi:hypothetical protein
MKTALLDVIVNGEAVATIGPLKGEHCSLSMSALGGKLLLSAMGLYKRGRTHDAVTWLDQVVAARSTITVSPSRRRRATVPLRARKLQLGKKATTQNKFCDFCKRQGSRSRPVVQAGDSPFICVDCAELCIEIAKG